MKLLPRLRRLFRLGADRFGVSVFTHNKLPIGTDYRKTLRSSEVQLNRTLDVGANVGQFSLHLLEVFPKCEIVCFEPVSATFQILQANTSQHPQVTCVKMACGEEAGEVEVFLQERSDVNSLSPDRNVHRGGTSSEVVKVTRLDDYCTEADISGIDLLKVDTEGFDLAVLKGADRLLSEGRIDRVLVEVTFNSVGTKYSDVESYLKGHGFHVSGFYNQTSHGRQTGLSYCDALFTRYVTSRAPLDPLK